MTPTVAELCGEPPDTLALPPAPPPLRVCPSVPHDAYTLFGGGRCRGDRCATWFVQGAAGADCLDGVRVGPQGTMQFRYVAVGRVSREFMCTAWAR